MDLNQECPVCFEKLTNRTSVVPPCGHMFHQSCVESHMLVSTSPQGCPICRKQLLPSQLVRVMSGLPDSDAITSTPTCAVSPVSELGSPNISTRNEIHGQKECKVYRNPLRRPGRKPSASRQSAQLETKRKQECPVYRNTSDSPGSKESSPPQVPRSRRFLGIISSCMPNKLRFRHSKQTKPSKDTQRPAPTDEDCEAVTRTLVAAREEQTFDGEIRSTRVRPRKTVVHSNETVAEVKRESTEHDGKKLEQQDTMRVLIEQAEREAQNQRLECERRHAERQESIRVLLEHAEREGRSQLQQCERHRARQREDPTVPLRLAEQQCELNIVQCNHQISKRKEAIRAQLEQAVLTFENERLECDRRNARRLEAIRAQFGTIENERLQGVQFEDARLRFSTRPATDVPPGSQESWWQFFHGWLF